MIEAELKAHVHAPEAVMRQLDERAEARIEVYRDTYYDRPDGSLEKAGEELRVRTKSDPSPSVWRRRRAGCLLTVRFAWQFSRSGPPDSA